MQMLAEDHDIFRSIVIYCCFTSTEMKLILLEAKRGLGNVMYSLLCGFGNFKGEIILPLLLYLMLLC
jgi:hypothetical protein